MLDKKRFSHRGFTLIELLVVMAIIGILASTIMSSLAGARAIARDGRRISDLGQIKLALEMYYEDHGSYPPAPCGYDCNGYYYSYDASWTVLAGILAPYIDPLPTDPLNAPACQPWGANCYTYTYGNVGKVTYPAQFDLTGQFENPSQPLRCDIRGYYYYFNNLYTWCPANSGKIYEVS